MRFAVAAIFIGAAIAGKSYDTPSSVSESIVYETHHVTKTQCPPEVTDCPAESIQVETSIVAVTTTYCPEEAAESSAAAAWPTYSSSCDSESSTETCTVTVTKPKSWGTGGPWVPTKNATATAWATGTGSPVTPTGSYYSNAASSLKGGALAIGAGAFALLAL